MSPPYTFSIPTPPMSPEHFMMPDENRENPLLSTTNLLDTLVAYYQQERMWVYQTKTILDDALSTGSNPSTNNVYPDHQSSSRANARMGPPYGGRPNNPHRRQDQKPSRWMRRKKSFKLRIDGIREFTSQPFDESQEEEDDLSGRKQILEMFDKMLETRLESCQRVDKLIREANQNASRDLVQDLVSFERPMLN